MCQSNVYVMCACLRAYLLLGTSCFSIPARTSLVGIRYIDVAHSRDMMHPTYDYPELIHNTLGEYTTCLPCPTIRNCTPILVHQYAIPALPDYPELYTNTWVPNTIQTPCLPWSRSVQSTPEPRRARGRNLAHEHAVSAGLSARSEHSQTDTHHLYDTTPVLFGSKHLSE